LGVVFLIPEGASMPLVVVLHSNIYDHKKQKRQRGDQFEAPRDFCDAVMKSDEGKPARITVIDQPKPAKKGARNEVK